MTPRNETPLLVARIAGTVATIAVFLGLNGIVPDLMFVILMAAGIVMFVALLTEVRQEFGHRHDNPYREWKRR